MSRLNELSQALITILFRYHETLHPGEPSDKTCAARAKELWDKPFVEMKSELNIVVDASTKNGNNISNKLLQNIFNTLIELNLFLNPPEGEPRPIEDLQRYLVELLNKSELNFELDCIFVEKEKETETESCVLEDLLQTELPIILGLQTTDDMDLIKERIKVILEEHQETIRLIAENKHLQAITQAASDASVAQKATHAKRLYGLYASALSTLTRYAGYTGLTDVVDGIVGLLTEEDPTEAFNEHEDSFNVSSSMMTRQ